MPNRVTTYAGTGVVGFDDGPSTMATFNLPVDVQMSPEGLYVADAQNAAVRLISPDGMVTTVVGRAGPGFRDGPLATAQLRHPVALARDSQGRILVADNYNHAIRRIEKNGTLSTVVGTGSAGYSEGNGTQAQFNEPEGIVLDSADVMYIADKNNRVIRRVDANGATSLFCGQPGVDVVIDGPCLGSGRLEFPTDIEQDDAGNFYVTEWGMHVVRKIAPDGTLSTVLGSTGTRGWADGPAAGSILSHPSAVLWDNRRNVLWFLDHDGGHRVRQFDGVLATSVLGPKTSSYVDAAFLDGTDPRFAYPDGVALGSDGSLYIADVGNHRIRRASAD